MIIGSTGGILNNFPVPESMSKVVNYNRQKVEETNIQSDSWISNMRKQGVKAEPHQPYVRFYVKA